MSFLSNNKTVRGIRDLNIQEVHSLAYALRTNSFNLILIPSKNHDASIDGILDAFITTSTYCYILDDKNADFGMIAIKYSSGALYIAIPIAVYGICNARKTYFPLQLNSFGRELLSISFEQAVGLFTKNGKDLKHEDYIKLIPIRESFIRRIFELYYNLNEIYNSAMAWRILPPNSLTKDIAKDVKFNIVEINSSDNLSELFTKYTIDEKFRQYFIECGKRWGKIFCTYTGRQSYKIEHSQYERDYISQLFMLLLR